MNYLILLWFCSSLSDAHQEKHFLHYKFTARTKADSFPEFSAEAVADDRRIKRYSDEGRVWILTEGDAIEALADPPESRNWFLHQIRTLSNCSDSQCSELHVLQRFIGCELEKHPDGSVNLTVFDEYGLDGEDFISFDSVTMQWIEKSPEAKETKREWDLQTGRNKDIELYLENCERWISTFQNTIKSSPDVRVSVKEADENHLDLICLATGFHPRDIQMNIRLDKTKLEDQTSSGIRPNHDETFQMRISVKIHRNHSGFYDCLVNHSSLTLSQPVLTVWNVRCSDCEAESSCVVEAAVTVITLIVTLYCLYRKRTYGGWGFQRV